MIGWTGRGKSDHVGHISKKYIVFRIYLSDKHFIQILFLFSAQNFLTSECSPMNKLLVNDIFYEWKTTPKEHNLKGITRLLKNNIMEAMQEPDDISLPAYLANFVLSLAQLSPSLFPYFPK